MAKPLTQRELMAIQHYMEGSSYADAMRLAGYAETTSRHMQNRVFDKPSVAAEIKRRQAMLRKKHDLDEDWVIQRMMRIADSGEILARFKKVTKDGKLDWDFTGATQDELAAINELTVTTTTARGETTTKFKVGSDSPKGALDSLMRKMGMFQDNLNVSGEMSLTERITAGRNRVNKGNKGDAEE